MVTVFLAILSTLLLCGTTFGETTNDSVLEPIRDNNGVVKETFWEGLPVNQWVEIGGTRLADAAPNRLLPGALDVSGVVDAWSGAAFDSKRENVLVWGVGYAKYAGNELYEFSIARLDFSRRWGPSPLRSISSFSGAPAGSEALSDGIPAPRRTYGGLTYAENVDAFVSFSGSLHHSGSKSRSAWQFDLADGAWKGPISGANPAYGTVAVYDSGSGHIFTGSSNAIQEYDPVKMQFIASYATPPISYISTATVIPKRRLMLILGNGKLSAFNFDTKNFKTLTVAGETHVVKPLSRGAYDFYYAGFVYAEKLDTVFVWDNNGALFAINPDNWTIRKLEISGTPPAKPVNGMFGRMAFVPSKNLLVLITHANRNVIAVRLKTPLELSPLVPKPTGQSIVVRGKNFTSVAAAAEFAKDGDVVEFKATTYREDGAIWPQSNLTLRGVNGRAHMEGGAVAGKGIWVIKGKNVTVENIEFSNASVDDRNGAGIRHEGEGLTIRNCLFRDNENGILTGANLNNEVIIEGSEFSGNGDGSGQTHNMYIGQIKKFTLRGAYIHHARVGHNVKSRAQTNFIQYNRIMDEASGTASYSIDLPDGGVSYVIGNIIQQGPESENSGIISVGAEKLKHNINEIYLVNNTIVNDKSNGSFLYTAPGVTEIKIINNIFSGPGKLPAKALGNGNVRIERDEVIDAARYDYHLKPNSVAVDVGIDPGTANGYGLSPEYEYEKGSPLKLRVRQKSLDAGAYELKSSKTTQ